MERIINLLVEYDKTGQQIVREAQRKRSEELSRLDEYKEKMRRDYEERCAQRIEKFRQQAEQEKEEQLQSVKKEYEQKLSALREQFTLNSGRWVQEIVSRCIGG